MGSVPERQTDVAVIGGGVIGIACALELARRGATVTVLERDRVGHGCSYGNAGWLTPSLALPLTAPGQTLKAFRWLLDRESPFYIRPRLDPALFGWLLRFLTSSRKGPFERGARALIELCSLSVDYFEQLAKSAPDDFGFRRDGLLCVYEKKESLEEDRGRASFVERFGIESTPWSAEEVREREPVIRGAQIGGLFFPGDAHCEPYRAVEALVAEARQLGVLFQERSEVTGVERNGAGHLVTTGSGSLHAREVVLAAGAWSGSLGKRIGLRLPMLGAKGYSVLLPRREVHPRSSIYLAERKVAINPQTDALRVAGTLELVGEDLSVDRRRVAAILRGASEMLDCETPDAERAEVWAGLRPCTPDGMPAIGRARGSSGLWIATGHQMTGLKTAPASGKLLAELMTGETPSVDPEPFRADRF